MMKRFQSLGLLGLFGLLALGCMVNPKVDEKGHAAGEVAPLLEGRDADDLIIRLTDLKGKVILVDFWQTL